MSLLRAVARLLGARSGGFSVRQRLLGIVLVAALVFSAVAAVAALSSESVGRTAAEERRVVALKETYLLFDALLGKLRGGVYEVVATETELASAKAGASREEAEEALEEYAEIRARVRGCGCRDSAGRPGRFVAEARTVRRRAVDRRRWPTADETVGGAEASPAIAAKRLNDSTSRRTCWTTSVHELIAQLSVQQDRAVADTISSERERRARS